LSELFNEGGILVSFEGLDASGKDTQSKLLCEFLKRENVLFEYLSFPAYSTPIGSEIRDYLLKKREYSSETIHTLYSANRYEFKNSIGRWIAEKRVIVLNRYCESNIAYGVADGLPLAWLRELESRMPQADYVFYLRINPELSLRRKVSRDRFESDARFLNRVSQVYDALATAPNWITVNGEENVEMISYEITKALTARLQDRGSSRQNKNSQSSLTQPGVVDFSQKS
jgi:dTMP kinase